MRAVVEPLVPNTKEPAERRLPPNVTFPVSVEVPGTERPMPAPRVRLVELNVAVVPSTEAFKEA